MSTERRKRFQRAEREGKTIHTSPVITVKDMERVAPQRDAFVLTSERLAELADELFNGL